MANVTTSSIAILLKAIFCELQPVTIEDIPKDENTCTVDVPITEIQGY